MVVLDLARGRLKAVLDRHFRREKYQLDRTLQRMSQAIEQLVDPPTLARRLLHTSAELLGVARGAVYLREGDPPLYRLAEPWARRRPWRNCRPAARWSRRCATQGRRWPSAAPEARPTPAQRQLQFLGGEVAQALIHEGQLLGLLVLGAARGSPAIRPEDSTCWPPSPR